MRIDRFLAEEGLAQSRTHAANLIKLNRVFLDGAAVTKPSFDVKPGAEPEVRDEDRFYSLGGCKLDRAISVFGIDLKNKTALDAGCANGGFTGVLLNAGVGSVYAVDVGDNALPADLNADPRVTFYKKNVRALRAADFPKPIDFIAADLSFISLKTVLPTFYTLLPEKKEGVFLIKPQFEAGKAALSKSGIVKDPHMRGKIVEDLSEFSKKLGFCVLGVTEAPHPFPNKNLEFLLYLQR